MHRRGESLPISGFEAGCGGADWFNAAKSADRFCRRQCHGFTRLKCGQVAGRVAGLETKIKALGHVPLDLPSVLASVGEAGGDGRPGTSRPCAVKQRDWPRLQIVIIRPPAEHQVVGLVTMAWFDGR